MLRINYTPGKCEVDGVDGLSNPGDCQAKTWTVIKNKEENRAGGKNVRIMSKPGTMQKGHAECSNLQLQGGLTSYLQTHNLINLDTVVIFEYK